METSDSEHGEKRRHDHCGITVQFKGLLPSRDQHESCDFKGSWKESRYLSRPVTPLLVWGKPRKLLATKNTCTCWTQKENMYGYLTKLQNKVRKERRKVATGQNDPRRQRVTGRCCHQQLKKQKDSAQIKSRKDGISKPGGHNSRQSWRVLKHEDKTKWQQRPAIRLDFWQSS